MALRYYLIAVLLLFSLTSVGQNLYFPPLAGSTWDTMQPATLGWCPDKIDTLYQNLEDHNTKAFIVLKDGKIVLEQYFGTFAQDSFWYWASAGKSLTAFLVGIAQEKGQLSITDKSSDYLGTGWTAAPQTKEDLITIRHQLTMTTGLETDGVELDCTLDTCLQYRVDAGTRWYYHNAPYTLLDGVIEAAAGQDMNTFLLQNLSLKTGIIGQYYTADYNNVFFSKPRSMARFGLLMLNNGVWDNTTVLGDTAYINQMTNTSQNMNESYGYLWWLNGKSSFLMPGTTFEFQGSIMPHAPDDMVSGLGKNGQYVNVVPSMNMVVVRMGDDPFDSGLVPAAYNDTIWALINELDGCNTTAVAERELLIDLTVSPNPATDHIRIDMDHSTDVVVEIFNTVGELVLLTDEKQIDIADLEDGIYLVRVNTSKGSVSTKLLVK